MRYPNNQTCLPWVLYLFYEEKLNKLSKQSSQISEDLSPQYQHFLVQQNSEAIHEVLSQNRALSLQDHHNLIPMNKLHLTRGWGEVMFICLHAQSFAIMRISYMLLHLHVGSVVNTSTGNTNISAATLLQTALC